MPKSSLREKLKEYLREWTPLSEMCTNCLYYIPHYTHPKPGTYVEIDHGHCTRRNQKSIRAYDACPEFTNRYYD